MRTITESESTPKADGFFMPAEFAPQDRVWMGWPHCTDTGPWRQAGPEAVCCHRSRHRRVHPGLYVR